MALLEDRTGTDRPTPDDALTAIGDLLDEGRTDEALREANVLLDDHYDDWRLVYGIAGIFYEVQRFGLAHNLYARARELNPKSPEPLNGLGRVAQEQCRYKDGKKWFREALKRNPDHVHALTNLGLVSVNEGDYDGAEKYLQRALDIDPDLKAAQDNMSMVKLARRDWRTGWRYYSASLGISPMRRERVYGDEKRWKGENVDNLIVYGEQGIGDEVMFASCVPDVLAAVPNVVVETESRLQGLFQRSFPSAKVYGTRYKEEVPWLGDHKFDARVSIGTLPAFCRNNDADFPGTAYLVACPDRRKMVRALLDSIRPKNPRRPKIGIAWSGGSEKTRSAERSMTLDQFQPLFDAIDADWISLQYRDADGCEDYGVHHYRFLTQTSDYDDTAALVAELDAVVTVTTAVFHLAGGLGVKTVCYVPERPTWRYGLQGQTLPWYSSVLLLRQQGGVWPIEQGVDALYSILRQKGFAV